MNFDLSETQELFRSTTEKFVRDVDVIAREKIRSAPCGYERTRWTKLSELGLLAIAASEDQGGVNSSIDDLSIIAETLGRNNALDPWLENGIFPIRLLSKAKQTDDLEALLDGSKIAAVAFAEPSARYDLTPHDTIATELDNNSGFSLSGQKQFIMGGTLADFLLVTATYNDDFAMFCLPADSSGIESQAYRLTDGSEGSILTLNQVTVPSNAKIDLSFDQFQNVVAELCLLCSAEMLGLSQLLLDDTLNYVKERKQFSVAIGSFQVIQHGLVDCYCELEQMRSLLFRTLLLENDSSPNWRANIMGLKSFTSDGANLIASAAVQYHGAMGITDEVSIGHALKRIMLLSRLFGDTTENLKQYMDAA